MITLSSQFHRQPVSVSWKTPPRCGRVSPFLLLTTYLIPVLLAVDWACAGKIHDIKWEKNNPIRPQLLCPHVDSRYFLFRKDPRVSLIIGRLPPVHDIIPLTSGVQRGTQQAIYDYILIPSLPRWTTTFLVAALLFVTAFMDSSEVNKFQLNSMTPRCPLISKLQGNEICFDPEGSGHVIEINRGNAPYDYDQANIICPRLNSEVEGGVASPEKYIVYNVSKEEYESCRITNPNPRIIAICDQPDKILYFTVSFRSFTPLPGGLEFRPGHDYYFISTSSEGDLHRRVGGTCKSNHMKLMLRICCHPNETDHDAGTQSVPGTDMHCHPSSNGYTAPSRSCSDILHTTFVFVHEIIFIIGVAINDNDCGGFFTDPSADHLLCIYAQEILPSVELPPVDDDFNDYRKTLCDLLQKIGLPDLQDSASKPGYVLCRFFFE
ncbi:unnamed protein product [Cyprideis torosa]|uniref:Uncharacterized protein n=1 Tax=Cyprideis torosa TaxID=163714 RepID=A0A7R8W1I8_9CRUS|nr:unnamed protein product [Cyprideis torosa]CAG0880949.1 unnamed protein product [Cyprideis torosa]